MLLLLLAFNIIGYRTWFYFAEKKADLNMEARLDKDEYNSEDLIELKIPLDIPYQIEQNRFEKVSGEITVNGSVYKYVKRKVSNGTLILLCIPDKKKTAIRQVKIQYGNYVNDITTTAGKESGHQANHEKHAFSEYESFIYRLSLPQRVSDNTVQYSRFETALTNGYLLVRVKPPCLIA